MSFSSSEAQPDCVIERSNELVAIADELIGRARVSREAFIPETPAQLTPEWLTRVLTDAGTLNGQSVTAAAQEVLGDGAGFVGDIVRLHLELDRPADVPATIVAKMPKLANRVIGEVLGAYERENMFYMTLARGLPVATPTLFYGEFDRDAASEKQEEIMRQADKIPSFLQGPMTRLAFWIAGRKKRRYILLMEDVGDAVPYDQMVGVDRTEMARILAATARLHAHFWEQELLREQFWILPLDIDARMRQQLMLRSTDAFADMFEDILESGLAPFVEETAAHAVDHNHALAEGPTTLLHCDLRLDNLFLRGDEVVFIDWQLVRRGNPAYDVAYLLSSGLRDDDSAEELLAGYHRALVAAGVSGYGLEDLSRDYRLALRVVLMTLSTVDQVELGSGRGTELLHTWIGRLQQRLTADPQAVS